MPANKRKKDIKKSEAEEAITASDVEDKKKKAEVIVKDKKFNPPPKISRDFKAGKNFKRKGGFNSGKFKTQHKG